MSDSASGDLPAALELIGATLEMLRDTDEAGFLKFWRTRVVSYRGVADEMLACLALVLAAPPADLREQLYARVGFVLNHVEPTRITPYSNDDVIVWLRALDEKLRAIYDEVVRSEQ